MNNFIKQDIIYHGSKKGLDGPIKLDYKSKDNNIKARNNTDFGLGFYMGTNYKQCLGLVNSEANPYMYELKIPKHLITKENTLILDKKDWMYFVMYNRGKLEQIKGTQFYEYYKHLADNKQYIIGAIADDSFNLCMDDFTNGYITDYTFMQLIDCFNIGNQIVAKSQEACNEIEIINSHLITKDERKQSISSIYLTRAERNIYYKEQCQKFNSLRKGKFLNEIFNEARKSSIIIKTDDIEKYQNIKFPDRIHDEGDNEIELYR